MNEELISTTDRLIKEFFSGIWAEILEVVRGAADLRSGGLASDWWDGHVTREVGDGHGRLLQSYGVHQTTRKAAERGLCATRRVENDGSILLILEGGAL